MEQMNLDDEQWGFSDEARDELEADPLTASMSVAEAHKKRADREEWADYVMEDMGQLGDGTLNVRFRRWLIEADRSLQEDMLTLIDRDRRGMFVFFDSVIQLVDGRISQLWGPGPGGINLHTLGAFAQALGLYLLTASDEPTVVLAAERGARDLPSCRVVAEVLASQGVVTYLSPEGLGVDAVTELVGEKRVDLGVCLSEAENGMRGPVVVVDCEGEPLCQSACDCVNRALQEIDVFDDVRRFDLRKALREELVIPLGGVAKAENGQ
ncbi:MAG: hypothetical protein Q4D06_02185 [Coriobacteriia bacterium]|nr:hypothetical protein [Coriobacteriia bacterium]